MNGAYQKIKLGDVVQFCYGKSLTEEIRKVGEVPVYGSSGIVDYNDKFLVKGPGVIVGRKGNVGSVYFERNNFFPIDTVFFLKKINDADDLKYLYYLLKYLPLNKLNSDSAVPGLNRETALRVKTFLPNPFTQQKITDILTSYDNLIEVNQKQIQHLEEPARLLFREWFVYFRFPGHEKVKIVDGVPVGWEKLQVKDIIKTINSRKKIQKSEYDESGLYPCVDQSQEYIGGYTDKKDYLINNIVPIVVFGDHTRIVKYVDFPFVSGADGTQLLVSKLNKITSEFLYFILKNINLSNYFYARHFKFLKDQWILVPSENHCISFNQFSKNIMKQISILRSQNQKLAQARDLLLPRLMSGAIEV